MGTAGTAGGEIAKGLIGGNAASGAWLGEISIVRQIGHDIAMVAGLSERWRSRRARGIHGFTGFDVGATIW